MRAPAPAAVPVEIRALDTGPKLERVFRLTQSIGEDGILFAVALPWEARRPVSLLFRLPGDEQNLEATGVIQEVRPERPDQEAQPRAVAFVALEETQRTKIRAYVQERMLLP